MKKMPYQRKPGDFEIRILPDGQVMLLAPDQKLLELAEVLDPEYGRQVGKKRKEPPCPKSE
ncbi:MAG TPA: hypothetical protein PLL36_07720 [Candidatus Hydrogenedentes bacterium]|nr:hypothetical protein [Candidatus Hydrogenedentota bacterium]